MARLRGTGARKPLLLLAHLDVVEARREDWDFDPFKLQEADGYFRGRGAIDDKAMAAMFVANLIDYAQGRLQARPRHHPGATADEELSDSPHNGVRWLLENHRALIDAEFAINEGGGGALAQRRTRSGSSVQLAEKVYQTYRLEVTDRRRPQRGAASRQPDLSARRRPCAARAVRFSAAAQCGDARLFRAAGRDRDARDRRRRSRRCSPARTDAAALAPLAADPNYNAQMRTTCVATMLEAGHAENALPQTARATVNCRILPDEPVEEVAAHAGARHRRRQGRDHAARARRCRARRRRPIPR